MPGGRPPGPNVLGKPAGSGRKKGSIDRDQRRLLTDRMAGDLMAVYEQLGGVKWLLQFAKENPVEFLRQGLSRLMPAPQKDDDTMAVNQLNIGRPSELEAATRIAYVLSLGLHKQQEQGVCAAVIPPLPVSPDADVYRTTPGPEREE